MTQITSLDNGLRVASEKLPGMETVGLALSVDVGARYETTDQQGLSHLLEHMAFKGTKRRNARGIAEAFDEIGGNFNAYTSLEHTVYHARVLSNDLPVAMDIIGDILQHSIFEEEELQREKQVILQEIAMHKDAPEEVVYDLFHETAYPDQAIGRNILGTEAHIRGFTRNALFDYVNAYYHPARMVLSAAGNVNHDALVKLALQHFALPPSRRGGDATPGIYQGGDRHEEQDLEQAHIMLGLKGVDVRHKDYYTMQLLSSVLGGGMSSRLFQEIREKRGLAYTIVSFPNAYSDTGLLAISASTTPEHANMLLELACKEMQGMTTPVSDAELRRAKTQQMASLLMARESAMSVSEWMGRHLLIYGEVRTAEQMIARFDAITAKDVAALAERVLSGAAVTLTALGPVKNVMRAADIQAKLAA
jgi:predicted Zn-dependent peptidase